jgi:hypothetical protein
MIEKTSNIIVPWAVGNGMLDMPSSFELVHLFAGKEEIFIGRSPENDIWLNHPAVSRIHASLLQKSDGSLLVLSLIHI